MEADAPLARLYFVETGVVSLLTVPENRAAVGVAAVGREGALGRAQVLVPGSSLVMEVPAFRRALRRSAKLRGACQRFTRALLVQMLQAVPSPGCTRRSSVVRDGC